MFITGNRDEDSEVPNWQSDEAGLILTWIFILLHLIDLSRFSKVKIL
jgi:hypothetical protein